MVSMNHFPSLLLKLLLIDLCWLWAVSSEGVFLYYGDEKSDQNDEIESHGSQVIIILLLRSLKLNLEGVILDEGLENVDDDEWYYHDLLSHDHTDCTE